MKTLKTWRIVACVAGLTWVAGCGGDGGGAGDVDASMDAAADGAARSGREPSIGLALGGEHSCDFRQGGGVRCWGEDMFGQSGGVSSQVPAPVPGTDEVTQLSLSAYSTCAVASTGHALCWGLDMLAQPVDGGALSGSARPRQIPGLEQVRQVCVAGDGDQHACALLADKTVHCWGEGKRGQLGDGTGRSSATPVRALVGPARQIACGMLRSCALLEDGTVSCWGNNLASQLGTGVGDRALTPARLPAISNAVQVGLSDGGGCVRLQDGTARCWGLNPYGEVGDGTTETRPTPVSVLGVSNARSLAVGGDVSCVIEGGDVKCWGSSGLGQQGDDGPETCDRFGQLVKCHKQATIIPALAGAVEVALGRLHGCARFAAGEVSCFGVNEAGQVGDGTTETRLLPVRILPR